MVNYDDVLKKLKKNTRRYTLLELANNNEEAIDEVKKLLLKILDNEISSLPYSNEVDEYKYIYKIFKYICAPTTKEEKESLIKKFKELNKVCQKKINNSHKNRNRKRKLKVVNKIQNLIELNLIYLEKYIFDEVEEITKEQVLYDLFNYLVFEIKNYDYLSDYIKTFSSKTNVKDKNGKVFIEQLVDKYLCEVVYDNQKEFSYLERVIKLFLECPNIELKIDSIRRIQRKLLEAKKEIASFSISPAQKQKMTFFIDGLINCFDDNKCSVKKILKDVYNMLDNIVNYEIQDKEKKLLISYFDYLIDIIKNNKYGMNIIQELNKYAGDINKTTIDADYKKKVLLINETMIKHISNLNMNHGESGHLDYKYSIKADISKEIQNESEKIVIDNGEPVLDCRNKYIITIDGVGTEVYDDAISIESFHDGTRLLGIYLADVASFVKPGTLIDKRALDLGETLQLPRKYIPMLPHDVLHKLTLKENIDRRAIGYFFLLDKNMNIISFSVKKCLITISENFNYDSANCYLTDSRELEEIRLLKDMLIVSRNINTIDTPGKNYRVMKNIKKGKTSKNIVKESLSNNMIVNYMVFLNSFIANFFNKHPEIPFIYRNNLAKFSESIEDKLLEITRGDYSNIEVTEYINTILPPSFYSTINQGHSGLNLDAYCHATNPLRKYCSLEIQRLTEKYLINKDKNVDINEERRLQELSRYLNERLLLNREYNQELSSLHAKTLTK